MAAISLGLLGPVFLSKLTNRKECEIQKPFLLFSTLGFVAHNMLDGVALVMHPLASQSTHLLALAVALHRFVESIAIFKTTRKSFGNTISTLILLGLSSAMVLGYFFGEQIFLAMDDRILHVLQALACGMIFHVVLHPHHLKEMLARAKTGNIFGNKQSIGAFCGLALAVLAYLFWPAHTH
jgi:zinc transporter ZupT